VFHGQAHVIFDKGTDLCFYRCDKTGVKDGNSAAVWAKISAVVKPRALRARGRAAVSASGIFIGTFQAIFERFISLKKCVFPHYRFTAGMTNLNRGCATFAEAMSADHGELIHRHIAFFTMRLCL
jgi:hypothetical protein